MNINFIVIFILIIIGLIFFSYLPCACKNKENYENVTYKTKPKLWLYWENEMPTYIKLCIKSIYRHCSQSFDIIQLDEKKIYDYLPELYDKKFDFSNLLIAQKVDYYRIFLLYKYGGLYLDSDTLVLRDPIEIINKLDEYDFVGLGCTGIKCNYGYGKPSNGILASRKKGKLVGNVLNNIEDKLGKSKTKFQYFDLGKYIIWEELDKLFKTENYKYYHYSNDYDGTRDVDGKWINLKVLFSNEKIIYRYPDKMIFIVLYNSGMDKYKNMTEEELINSDLNISKFIKKSLY